MNPWVKAMSMPRWDDCPYELPEDVEVRRDGDLAAFVILGTDKALGFNPELLDQANIPALLERLRRDGK